jgi:hypothetical protein
VSASQQLNPGVKRAVRRHRNQLVDAVAMVDRDVPNRDADVGARFQTHFVVQKHEGLLGISQKHSHLKEKGETEEEKKWTK